jgi:type IV secretory pathway TrbD component
MDLRLPIGILFTIYGLMLAGYGFFTRGSAIYEKSLGININLVWGIVLLIFGLLMWFLAKRAERKHKESGPKLALD